MERLRAHSLWGVWRYYQLDGVRELGTWGVLWVLGGAGGEEKGGYWGA